MGTNFYIRENECDKCRRHEEVHLGKSSAGWKFSFQYNGGRYYKNIEEMREWLKDKKIWDEYWCEISHRDFWSLVESKRDGLSHTKSSPNDKTCFEVDGHDFTDGTFW
jgi:hypothetical protein